MLYLRKKRRSHFASRIFDNFTYRKLYIFLRSTQNKDLKISFLHHAVEITALVRRSWQEKRFYDCSVSKSKEVKLPRCCTNEQLQYLSPRPPSQT